MRRSEPNVRHGMTLQSQMLPAQGSCVHENRSPGERPLRGWFWGGPGAAMSMRADRQDWRCIELGHVLGATDQNQGIMNGTFNPNLVNNPQITQHDVNGCPPAATERLLQKAGVRVRGPSSTQPRSSPVTWRRPKSRGRGLRVNGVKYTLKANRPRAAHRRPTSGVSSSPVPALLQRESTAPGARPTRTGGPVTVVDTSKRIAVTACSAGFTSTTAGRRDPR